MVRYLIITLIIAFAYNTSAQDKFHFSSQNVIGVLEGEDGTAAQFYSINGMQYKKWFAGLGAGIDYYYIRSIPLFLSLNHNILSSGRTPYLFAEGGINFPWMERESDRWNNIISSEFAPSYYWSGGIGYKIGFKKRDAIVLNFGYSFKHIKETQEKVIFCVSPPCNPQIEHYNYYLKRLSFRFGWQL